jgi:hypothetical protein
MAPGQGKRPRRAFASATVLMAIDCAAMRCNRRAVVVARELQRNARWLRVAAQPADENVHSRAHAAPQQLLHVFQTQASRV